MKLNDVVAVSGLLLTLVTFLFNLAWPNISKVLNADENITGENAKKRLRKTVNSTAFKVVLPILIAFFVLFYVNLPTAIEIILNSDIDFWHFDVDDTLYVMVVFALLAFVFFNAALLIKFIKKQNRLK